jgi:hypothetical protein
VVLDKQERSVTPRKRDLPRRMIGHFLNPFQNLEKQRKIAKFLETFIGNIFSLKNKRNYCILFA